MAKKESVVKKLGYEGLDGIFKVRETLRTRYKLLYIAMVFVGLTLCWYGVWRGVQVVPIINNPVVAIIAGLVLLVLTGRVNKLG